jgi:hypothetical protein
VQNKFTRRQFVKVAASGAAAVAGSGALAGCVPVSAVAPAAASDMPETWDHEADIVIVGGGICGLVSAIRARDLGASVIVVEANYACGGHALTSGGHVHLGGGTSVQKRMGVEDSANQYYLDHTSPTSAADRYNIREVVRGAANVHAEAFEFLLENGWVHLDDSTLRGQGDVDSVSRTITTDQTGWTEPPVSNTAGIGLTRPLEVSARNKGAQFIMNHHMDKIYRGDDGVVVGIQASYTPRIPPGSDTPLVDVYTDGNIESTETVTVKASKAVLVATGGSSSNYKFHCIFDPRYGPEHSLGVGGDPFSFQDASGELACLAIGASLGATASQTAEAGSGLSKARSVGSQYGYRPETFTPDSPIWPFVRAWGLNTTAEGAEAGLIYVNMLGQRFFQEDTRSYDFLAAAMGSAILDADTPNARRVGGPIWAIFDADQVTRMGWNVSGPPDVDIENGFFFSGNTLAELAANIVNKLYEDYPMPAANLEETVARYNSFVDSGVDEDCGREVCEFKLQTPPFYAAWATPAAHDTLSGIWINGKFQVLDTLGEVIPHLYAVGESATGQGMHGHGKNVSSAYAASTNMVEETAA